MDESTEADGGTRVPRRRTILHYHGDDSRGLYVAGAILLIVAKSTGANLPFSTTGTVIAAVLLVVVAGITSPEPGIVHWINALVAVAGTIIFGITAVHRFSAGVSFFDSSFLYVEALALLSLIALYLTTRTIRGFQTRPHMS